MTQNKKRLPWKLKKKLKKNKKPFTAPIMDFINFTKFTKETLFNSLGVTKEDILFPQKSCLDNSDTRLQIEFEKAYQKLLRDDTKNNIQRKIK